MQVEITAAINLIAANLYNKLPRRRVDAFAEELEKGIVAKFQGHWYPENPTKGAAYRCINVSGDKVDPVIIYSVINSGLDMEEVNSYLPKDLTIWVDPGEVSFSIGEKGQVRLLYSERRNASETSPTAPNTYNNTSAGSSSVVGGPSLGLPSPIGAQPIGTPAVCANTGISTSIAPTSLSSSVVDDFTTNLSSSFDTLSLSSGSSNGSGWGQGSSQSPLPWSSNTTSNPWTPLSTPKPVGWNNAPSFLPPPQPPTFPMNGIPNGVRANSGGKTMTAAMFAQTKFGSTKLKNHQKRSNRLSPTDSFIRNMQPNNFNSMNGMTSNVMRPSTAAMNAVAAALDRRQQMPTSVLDFNSDHFMAQNPLPSRNTMPNQHSNGRLSPCNQFGSLGSTSHDWIDLTDMAVYPTGNQILAS